ncbi:hypothetical protein ACQPZZ_11980 [Microbispora sp. CA-135349]|uniref:hypothetical protein n=1 Tax=Microbispora sp. CA-135349 TaxID=3239953 RepID=UPI003D8E18AA
MGRPLARRSSLSAEPVGEVVERLGQRRLRADGGVELVGDGPKLRHGGVLLRPVGEPLGLAERLFGDGGGEESEINQFVTHVDADQRIEIDRMRTLLAETDG